MRIFQLGSGMTSRRFKMKFYLNSLLTTFLAIVQEPKPERLMEGE